MRKKTIDIHVDIRCSVCGHYMVKTDSDVFQCADCGCRYIYDNVEDEWYYDESFCDSYDEYYDENDKPMACKLCGCSSYPDCVNNCLKPGRD